MTAGKARCANRDGPLTRLGPFKVDAHPGLAPRARLAAAAPPLGLSLRSGPSTPRPEQLVRQAPTARLSDELHGRSAQDDSGVRQGAPVGVGRWSGSDLLR